MKLSGGEDPWQAPPLGEFPLERLGPGLPMSLPRSSVATCTFTLGGPRGTTPDALACWQVGAVARAESLQ